MAARGFGFLGWNTRFRGNGSYFILEPAVVDIGAGVRWLRDEMAGAEVVVLLGNSGGASLMSAYQAMATEFEGPPGDLFISLCAHPGRPEVHTAWIDPSVTDETDLLSVDPSLDMFDPDNGPPYSRGLHRALPCRADRAQRPHHGVGEGRDRTARSGRRLRPDVQHLPGVGRPAVPRPRDRSVRAHRRLLFRRPEARELRAVGHRRREHVPQLAVDVVARRVEVPGGAEPREGDVPVDRDPVDGRPGLLPERRADDLRRARGDGQDRSRWSRATTTSCSRTARATRRRPASPTGSAPASRRTLRTCGRVRRRSS